MGKSLHCTCTICHIERCIGLELALPESHEIYRQIVGEKPLFAGFPTVFHLVASVHGCRDAKDGATFSDLIFAQLLSGPAAADDPPRSFASRPDHPHSMLSVEGLAGAALALWLCRSEETQKKPFSMGA